MNNFNPNELLKALMPGMGATAIDAADGGDFNIGNALQAVSPALNLVPGVGTIASMGTNILGGLISGFQNKEKPFDPGNVLPQVSNPYMYGGQLQKYAFGGPMKQYNAPSHQMGGQMVDPNGNPTMMPQQGLAEIEKQETYSPAGPGDGFVFSDQIRLPNGQTLAQKAAEIEKKFGKYQDEISKATKERELKKLAEYGEKVKEQMLQQQMQQQMQAAQQARMQERMQSPETAEQMQQPSMQMPQQQMPQQMQGGMPMMQMGGKLNLDRLNQDFIPQLKKGGKIKADKGLVKNNDTDPPSDGTPEKSLFGSLASLFRSPYYDPETGLTDGYGPGYGFAKGSEDYPSLLSGMTIRNPDIYRMLPFGNLFMNESWNSPDYNRFAPIEYEKGLFGRRPKPEFDTPIENLLEAIDPTGTSSYNDANSSINTYFNSDRTLPTLGEAASVFGALPGGAQIALVGKALKGGSSLLNSARRFLTGSADTASKAASKAASNTIPVTGRTVGSTSVPNSNVPLSPGAPALNPGARLPVGGNPSSLPVVGANNAPTIFRNGSRNLPGYPISTIYSTDPWMFAPRLFGSVLSNNQSLDDEKGQLGGAGGTWDQEKTDQTGGGVKIDKLDPLGTGSEYNDINKIDLDFPRLPLTPVEKLPTKSAKSVSVTGAPKRTLPQLKFSDPVQKNPLVPGLNSFFDSLLPDKGSNLNPYALGLKGASLIGSAIDAFQKPEVDIARLPNFAAQDQYFAQTGIDPQAMLNQANLQKNAAVQQAARGAGSYGQFLNRVNAAMRGTQDAQSQALLSAKQYNDQMAMARGQRGDQNAAITSQIQTQTDAYNAANRAASRNSVRNFLDQLSQTGTSLNEIQYMKDAMDDRNKLASMRTMEYATALALKYPDMAKAIFTAFNVPPEKQKQYFLGK